MKIKFNVTGLDCPNCAAKLAAKIQANADIDSAKINFLTEKLTIETPLSEDEALEIAMKEAKAFSSDVKVTK